MHCTMLRATSHSAYIETVLTAYQTNNLLIQHKFIMGTGDGSPKADLVLTRAAMQKSEDSIVCSQYITSHYITSHHVTSHHITLHHITSHHISSHHITSRYITSHYITSHHVTSHYITSHHITLYNCSFTRSFLNSFISPIIYPFVYYSDQESCCSCRY